MKTPKNVFAMTIWCCPGNYDTWQKVWDDNSLKYAHYKIITFLGKETEEVFKELASSQDRQKIADRIYQHD